jgi:hypothetical protein
LFAGSDAGGERAAAMYSLIGSAEHNGIDAMTHLRFVLERIADSAINLPRSPLWAAPLRPHRQRPAQVRVQQ